MGGEYKGSARIPGCAERNGGPDEVERFFAMSGLPRVSVVIPNYNHARFLRRRLETVLQQTYAVDEILFLDDASTDGSLREIEGYLSDSRLRLVVNTENSGCPFRQWNRGVRMARGEFVWIAESDDYADPRFLETLVTALIRHRDAGLAYCRSIIVDANERRLRSWSPIQSATRWQKSFVNEGKDECKRYMVLENTIPNASAVVFRRDVYLRVGGAPEDVKIVGDWLLWVKMLMSSDVAYEAEPLSYFREHPGTVRAAMARNGRVIEENLDVLQSFSRSLVIPEKTWEAAFRRNIDLWIVMALRYGIPLEANARICRRARGLRPHFRRFLLWRLPATLSTAVPCLVGKAISNRLGQAVRRRHALPGDRPEAR